MLKFMIPLIMLMKCNNEWKTVQVDLFMYLFIFSFLISMSYHIFFSMGFSLGFDYISYIMIL